MIAVLSVVQIVAAEELPALDLLEYLSEWQDADGVMLEPEMFDDNEHTEPGDVAEVPDADL